MLPVGRAAVGQGSTTRAGPSGKLQTGMDSRLGRQAGDGVPDTTGGGRRDRVDAPTKKSGGGLHITCVYADSYCRSQKGTTIDRGRSRCLETGVASRNDGMWICSGTGLHHWEAEGRPVFTSGHGPYA